jgi:soluble lytic murein transglycosylase-like protein
VGALRSIAIAAALACSAPANAGSVDRWSGHIAEASARFGIPGTWIRRVMRAESGGQVMQDGRPIVSSAGAMGLMQLMPGTWRDMRQALGLGADPHDPRDNILAGSLYLRLMYDRFGYPGLFAAYNAGPRRYSDYLAGRRVLPAETRAYVATVARLDRTLTYVPRQTAIVTGVAASNGRPPMAGAATLRPKSDGLFVVLASATRR